MSPTYRTWVDGEVVKQNQQVQLRNKQEVIFGANERNDHVKIVFIIDNLAHSSIWRNVNVSLLISNSLQQAHLAKFMMTDNAEIIIGRYVENQLANPNELRLSGSIISKKHAIITYTNGQLFVRDTNSSNGTYLNTHLVQSDQCKRVTNGDTLQLGASENNEHIVMKVLYTTMDEPSTSEPHTARSVTLHQRKTFTILSANSKVLLSSFTQNTITDCQSIQYLNKQWLAMAVAAIIRNVDNPISRWDTNILDDVMFNNHHQMALWT